MNRQEPKTAPTHLRHYPIVTVDYENLDATAGDAKFLSIGKATWRSGDSDFSAKVFRWAENSQQWSPQGEELTLWRVLDLAILLVATINGRPSYLNEFVQNPQDIDALRDFLNDNMSILEPRINELKRLLKTKEDNIQSEGCPNIFSFATSELSQDAIIAWLMQWADEKYAKEDSQLHSLAQDFLRMVLCEDSTYEIHSVNVRRQWKNIDVCVEINDNGFLIIEDKTSTSAHDGQLERYKMCVEDEYKKSRENLYFTYLKTGNEPNGILKEIENKGYRTVGRGDIIACLRQYKGNNVLVISFLKHLEKIEEQTQSFRILPVKKWGWYAWEGFYKDLENRLDIDSWSYVSNPSGGFLGAWWHFVEMPNMSKAEMYLQIEQGKLCFKIYCGENNHSEIRQKCYELLMSKLGTNSDGTSKHPEIKKPDRFGSGVYMTIAVVEPENLFGTTTVDFDFLVLKLKEYQSIIDLCAEL